MEPDDGSILGHSIRLAETRVELRNVRVPTRTVAGELQVIARQATLWQRRYVCYTRLVVTCGEA